jgi:hypothetical protein
MYVELLSSARTKPGDFFSILLQLPESQHQENANGIGNHTGIEECETSLILRTAGLLFLVDKLIGQDKQGERQSQHTARFWPCILTADQEVGGEESAEHKNRRCESIPNDLCKESMPTGMRLERT